jgi:hypothetical protein
MPIADAIGDCVVFGWALPDHGPGKSHIAPSTCKTGGRARMIRHVLRPSCAESKLGSSGQSAKHGANTRHQGVELGAFLAAA